MRSKAPTLEDFMKGYQLEFFTQQDMFHGGKHLSDWLIERARAEGIRSATVFMGATGFGQDRRIQAAHMFDLIDHPVQVTMIVGETECERLFALLTRENLHLFYVKLPVEFGKVGE
jgi:PII-like signaling protein